MRKNMLHRRFCLGITVLVLVIYGGNLSVKAQEKSPIIQEARTINAVRTETPPVLDGKLNDSCWQKAKQIRDFRAVDSDRMVTHQSIGYVCYDESHLYIGMKCLMPKGIVPTVMEERYDAETGIDRGKIMPKGFSRKKPHDSNIFSDDIVEIMIDPGRSQSNYYQLAVSAFGSTWDSRRAQGGTQNDTTWNGDWTSAAYIEDGSWSMEMSVPFHILGISPGTGSTWGINLCRETKTPKDEYSSIAEQGTFNKAKKFAILKGLNVDFSKYFFQIGPNETRIDVRQDKPMAVLNLPVKNMTGKTKGVKIERWFTDPNGKESIETKVATLIPDETIVLPAEQLETEAFLANRTDAYTIVSVPKTKKVVISDVKDGTILAHSLVTRPWYCEAMRIDVNDPWRKEMGTDKSPLVSFKVHTLLSKESLEKGDLLVTLTSRETGKILASKSVSKPNEVTEFSLPTQDLPWGAYDVQAMFKDLSGKEMISSHASATVLPGGKNSIKVLNNLVSELMNAEDRGLLAEKEIEFMNPRDGWVFFSISGAGAPGHATLDSESNPLAVVWQLYAPAAEAMRYLPAGRHRLHMEGKFDHIVVRAIPELIYNCHASGYNWEFLRKDVLANCNTILGGTEDEYHMREWKEAGKKWITVAIAPGDNQTLISADKYYEILSAHQGFTNPFMDGVIVDAIGSSSEEQKIEIGRTLSRMVNDPKFRGREYRPWYGGTLFGSKGDRAYMKIVLESGWSFASYIYLPDKFTEKDARNQIQETIVKMFSDGDKTIFGSLRQATSTLGYMTHMPIGMNQDVNPGVNFKILMQMQMEALANDPKLFGLHGVMWYYSAYVDEENLRWAGRLFRHYGIEGKTEKLTNDPYQLTHIKNPDFEEGTKGWTITQAERGTITAKSLVGYGDFQSRYLGGSMGDTFLVTRRSSKGANEFSQEIKDLLPGRTYSMKMMTADYGNIIGDKSVEQKDVISIKLDNVEMVTGSDKNYQWTFPSSDYKVLGKFKRSDGHPAYMNFHWYVFRAKSKTAKLTISDWAKPDNPGGPAGQEIMYNFIEIQPYLED